MQYTVLPSYFTKRWAESGSYTVIPVPSQIGITAGAASLTDGFPPLTSVPISAGGAYPTREDFNGAFRWTTEVVQRLQAGAIFPYNSAFATAIGGYPKGALVAKSAGTGYWQCTADSNMTDPDGGSAANWVEIGVMLSGNQTVAGVKTFSSSPAVPTPALLDSSTSAASTAFFWANQSGVPGDFAHLGVSSTGANNIIGISADAIILKNAAGKQRKVTSVSVQLTTSGSTSGADGYNDVGVHVVNTWYYLYVICTDAGAVSTLSSTSLTPSLPSGYTFYARVGSFKTQSGSVNPIGFIQFGRNVKLLTPVTLASTATTVAFWTAVSVSASIPATAASVMVTLWAYNGSSFGWSAVAGNSTYTTPGAGVATAAPIYVLTNAASISSSSASSTIALESTSIYWGIGATSAYLYLHSWEDNL